TITPGSCGVITFVITFIRGGCIANRLTKARSSQGANTKLWGTTKAQLVLAQITDMGITHFTYQGQTLSAHYLINELSDGSLCLGHRLTHVTLRRSTLRRSGVSAGVDRAVGIAQAGLQDRRKRQIH